MKTICILCCVTLCLLSAIPQNEGTNLNDSLYCYFHYANTTIICTWSESQLSRHFVNMSLTRDNGSPACQMMEEPVKTPTHLNWTCNIPFTGSLYDTIHFTFSPDRSLEARLNDSNKGDEAKPKYLHCQVANDQTITCYWMVRLAVADSIDFRLYYKNEIGTEKECQPRCVYENPLYLSCNCNITDRVMLHDISVRPFKLKKSSKPFKVCEHVKLLPRNLSINETKQQETFIISWSGDVSDHIRFIKHYELCYWRENDLELNEVPSDCPGEKKEIPHDHDPKVLLQLGVHLKPSSNYSIKVRVRVKDPADPSFCYKGPWSEWSSVKILQTKAGTSNLLLYILIPVCVFILGMCALYGYRVLARYKKQWEDRIPTPNKSSIIEGFRKTKNGPSLPYEEHLYVEPYNKIQTWTQSMSKDSTHLKQDEDKISRPDKELIDGDDDIHSLFVYTLPKDEYPTASATDGYKPFTELINEQESKDMEDSQFKVCAFDGPYLFS